MEATETRIPLRGSRLHLALTILSPLLLLIFAGLLLANIMLWTLAMVCFKQAR